ncbi:redoxin domain-containing protein [Candidatus Poribacteria bacterium]|nr:redoxin domain-containing protein [Candidatus Poribacteria bacterium]
MKPNLLSMIVCVVIIASMVIITACFEKDVVEDVIGQPVETTPEPVETTPEPPTAEPEINTEVTPPEETVPPEMTTEVSPPVVETPEMTVEVSPPDEETTPEMPVEPEMTVEMDPEPTMEETTPEPDPLPLGDGLAIGATAPEFSLPDADGTIYSLSNYAGQKLVIAFYATST